MGQAAERTQRGSAAGRWLIVAALSMLVGALGAELLLSAPASEAEAASAGGGGAFAIAGKITADTYGLYLVDAHNGTICLYEYLPTERRLWLRAARSYVSDVKLEEYNTQPSPKEILKMVSEARRSKDTSGQGSP